MGFLKPPAPPPAPVAAPEVDQAQERAEERATAQQKREAKEASERMRITRIGGLRLLFSPERDGGGNLTLGSNPKP